MGLPVAELRSRIAEAALLTAEDVRAFETSLAAPPADAEAFAKELVRAKRLTSYQAQALLQNKAKALVLGDYVVLDKLGQGGMGMVLKAEHRRMKRVVALKVLSPNLTRTAAAVARFHREVQAAARLNHPHVVTAFDAGESKGVHYLVMEFVDGKDLSSLVKSVGPMAVDDAVRCIRQAALGLQYAHENGVVHRDIKPANLLLDKSGHVKILDMGLARIEDADQKGEELTASGQIMGTAEYMSPEQALNTKLADARSDVYSLGATLWYLLTGRSLYGGTTVMEKLLAHRDAPIPSLIEAVHARAAGTASTASPSALLRAVEALFRKMVAKSPADRPQTMAEVVAGLDRCLAEPESAAAPENESSDSHLYAFLRHMSAQQASVGSLSPRTLPPSRGPNPGPGLEDLVQKLPGAQGITAARPDPASKPTAESQGNRSTHPDRAASPPPQKKSQGAANEIPPKVSTGRGASRKKSLAASTDPAWRHDRRVQLGLGGTGAFVVLLVATFGIWHMIRSRHGDAPPVRGPVAAKFPGGGSTTSVPGRAVAPPQCLFVWLAGGPSQIDTFDPKPLVEGKSIFKAIDTTVPGVQFSEILPQLARQAHHLAVIRTVTHAQGDHPGATSLMRTGRDPDAASDSPTLACVLGRELGRPNRPGYVVVGREATRSKDGSTIVDAQYGAGRLGRAFDPVVLFPAAMRQLLQPGPVHFHLSDEARQLPLVQALLPIEDLPVDGADEAERYGGSREFLLARRLLERDVAVVEVVLGGWDFHINLRTLMPKRCESFDRPCAALLADLEATGRLRNMLVVIMGEFGRANALNGGDGRDHWSQGFSVVLGGGRVRGGRLVGRTSADGSQIVERPVSVAELHATIFAALGIDPHGTSRGSDGVGVPLLPPGTNPIAELIADSARDAPRGAAEGRQPPPAVAPFDAAKAKSHQAAWAAHLGEPVETANSIGMRFVVIPPGKFTMGEGKDAVQVELTRPFRLGMHEVAQGQYRSVTGAEPWKGKTNVREGADHAASYVSWDEAVAFCRKLTEQERNAGRLPADEEYRLPTEAEWEWACRAGTTTSFSFGHDASTLGEHAWFDANASKAGESYAHAVGLKTPNAWGLLDMPGNVWEGCGDWHGDKLPGGRDPVGPSEGSDRVYRGGSWYGTAGSCRSASRFGFSPEFRYGGLGFRVARSSVP